MRRDVFLPEKAGELGIGKAWDGMAAGTAFHLSAGLTLCGLSRRHVSSHALKYR